MRAQLLPESNNTEWMQPICDALDSDCISLEPSKEAIKAK